MSERTKLMVLMVLLGVLVLAAAFAVFGPNGLMRTRVKPVASKKVEERVITNPLPPAHVFGELADWLAPEGSGITFASNPTGPVFGLIPAQVVEEPVAGKEPAPVIRRVYAVQPPRLQGIFWSSDRPSALIDGERYYVGQKVKNTGFEVIGIETDVVKLRTVQGEEVVLDLLK